MDISKKLYLFAFLLVGLLGVVAYQQQTAQPYQADVLLEDEINNNAKRIIKVKDSDEDKSFLNQLPQMYSAAKTTSAESFIAKKKNFRVKRRENAAKIEVDLGEISSDDSAEQHNERIKEVEQALQDVQAQPLPPLPEGFFSAETGIYTIYRERFPPNDDLKDLILKMHSGLLKKVKPFSLITRVEQIFLMLFRTKRSYNDYLHRPDWSGAATNIGSKQIYITENIAFKSNFMHELTHIYFDGFFHPESAPKWLSEGYAVYVQSLYQTPDENEWLNKFRLKFAREEYIDFSEFTQVEDLDGFKDAEVAMWYAQAYSVVKFLLERYGRDDFFEFSRNLKSNMPAGRALFRAYGMPLNNISALESAWQANLRRKYDK